jgi:hypothetical protein
MSKNVTLCSSSNEHVWSNVRSARESLQTSRLRKEQIESHYRDPNRSCPTAGIQRYRDSTIVALP